MLPKPNRHPGTAYSDFPIDQMGNFSSMTTHNTPSRYALEIEGLEGYWAHVNFCNSNRSQLKNFLKFVAGQGLHVGYVHPKFAAHLKRFPGIFIFSEDSRGHIITLNRTLQREKDCTAAVEGVMEILRKEGKVHSWRNERYPVVSNFGAPSLFWLERACVPYMGTKAYHTHLNGFTIIEGEWFLWVSIRDENKLHQDFPGRFDHLVAGGQAVNLTPKENLIKYASARANIPASMAEKLVRAIPRIEDSMYYNGLISKASVALTGKVYRAIPVRSISYEQIDGETCRRDVIFCYDLEVPFHWQPTNNDGEIDAFKILRVVDVAKMIRSSTGSYKPNSALVVIDFLYRHGFINPNEHGYLELQQALQQGENE